MLIAIAIAFTLWGASIVYGFGLAIERFRQIIHQGANETLRAALARPRQKLLQEWRSRPRDSFWETFGELFEAGCYMVLGLGLFVIGLVILFTVLPAWKVMAILFGFACLAAAWWLARHYRRLRTEWRQHAVPPHAMEIGHRREVLFHLAGITILPIIGLWLLLSVI